MSQFSATLDALKTMLDACPSISLFTQVYHYDSSQSAPYVAVMMGEQTFPQASTDGWTQSIETSIALVWERNRSGYASEYLCTKAATDLIGSFLSEFQGRVGQPGCLARADITWHGFGRMPSHDQSTPECWQTEFTIVTSL